MGRSCSGPPSQGQILLLEGSRLLPAAPGAERPQPAIPSRIKGHEHPQLPATTNDTPPAAPGTQSGKTTRCQPGTRTRGFGPLPRHRALPAAPHPSSQGSRFLCRHLRPGWSPGPGPGTAPATALRPVHKGTGDWKRWESHHCSVGTALLGSSETTRPRRAAGVIRLPCKERAGHQGTWRRAGPQGPPPTPATPRRVSLPPCAQGRAGHPAGRPGTLPSARQAPRLSPPRTPQAVWCGSGRRALPGGSQAALVGAARGVRGEKRDPQSRQGGRQAESQPQSPRGQAENLSSIRHDLIRCPAR